VDQNSQKLTHSANQIGGQPDNPGN